VAVAGAGLVGRVLALRLLEMGWQVDLFDPDLPACRSSCAYTGAGMLAPYCELESGHPLVTRLGRDAVSDWQALLGLVDQPVPLQQNGSLVVAHPRDRNELERLLGRAGEHAEVLEGPAIRALEPDLGNFPRALFFPREGQIDNRRLLTALQAALERAAGLRMQRTDCRPGDYAWVFDSRGLGAREDDPELRGVRGELLYLRCADVALNRPVRVMHPRYPIYVVPREDQVFVVGATQIESESQGPVTLRSLMELLSAAYALHPAFAEAELLETSVNCRPAYPDNLPRVTVRGRRIGVNGLFRHGYLLAPRLCDIVCRLVSDQPLSQDEQAIVRRVA
jgi:glycine oxidase